MDSEHDDLGGAVPHVMNRRRVLVLAALSALGLASAADAAKRIETRDNDENKPRKSGGRGRDVARTAQKFKGARYRWGGASPKGIDCSGFTWYVYNKAAGKQPGWTLAAA